MIKKKSVTTMSSSVCTRCGKQRIIVESYEEQVETSLVVYKIAVCSDPECQKIVDEKLKEEQSKRVIIKNEQEKRELLRKASMAAKKRANSSI